MYVQFQVLCLGSWKYYYVNAVKFHVDYLCPVLNYRGASPCYRAYAWLAIR